MCNLYSQTKAQDAMRQLFEPLPFHDRAGNLPPQPEIYPDQLAPIVRRGPEALVLGQGALGPADTAAIPRRQEDRPGRHQCPQCGLAALAQMARAARTVAWCPSRALPNLTSERGGNVWFETADGRPAFFAGLHVPDWTSVRKVKDGETTDDLFAFLTTSPNAEVAKVHPKAMPVILTEPAEWQMWLEAEWPLAKLLQRPLRDGALVR